MFDRLTVCLSVCLTDDWLSDWPTDWLTDCLTDWLTDWPTDCLSRFVCLFVSVCRWGCISMLNDCVRLTDVLYSVCLWLICMYLRTDRQTGHRLTQRLTNRSNDYNTPLTNKFPNCHLHFEQSRSDLPWNHAAIVGVQIKWLGCLRHGLVNGFLAPLTFHVNLTRTQYSNQ